MRESRSAGLTIAAGAPGGDDGDDADDSDRDARKRDRDKHLAAARKRRAARKQDNPGSERQPSAGLLKRLASELATATQRQTQPAPPTNDLSEGAREVLQALTSAALKATPSARTLTPIEEKEELSVRFNIPNLPKLTSPSSCVNFGHSYTMIIGARRRKQGPYSSVCKARPDGT